MLQRFLMLKLNIKKMKYANKRRINIVIASDCDGILSSLTEKLDADTISKLSR